MTTGILGSGELWATASAVFWAITVVLFKKAGERASPLALNLFKDVVALACFLPVLLLIGQPLPNWSDRDWILVAASGVLGITVADSLFFAALNRLGAGLNAVVNCLYFPSLVTQAYLFLGRPVGPYALVGGSLVILGILVGSAGRPPPDRTRRDIVTGVVVGIVGVIAVGASVVVIDAILKESPVLFTTAARLVAATLVLVPIVLARPERRELGGLFRPSRWWRVAVPASVFGAALAMWAWLKGFAASDDYATVAILNQLSTFFIFVLAGLVLHEPFTKRRGAAVVLALVGVAVVIASM